MVVEEVTKEFPNNLSGIISELIDWTPKQREIKSIVVKDHSMPWLIKVNKDRCPVCGTVEKSQLDWCDPRPDMDCDD